jgi:hypothetical protein
MRCDLAFFSFAASLGALGVYLGQIAPWLGPALHQFLAPLRVVVN